MSSPGFEMSLEHQIPVLIKKPQMSGEHGSQCGLTSLLPMSCRGRAAAFARDLHTRLRNLGAHQDDDTSNWQAHDPAVPLPSHAAATAAAASSPDRPDVETFYDFELECESPSSPVGEIDAPFSDRPPVDVTEPPFYEFDLASDLQNSAKLKLQQPVTTRANGFTFSTAFYSDCSPVKLQPAPRENGSAEKHLYSPITFDGCARQNGYDEPDSDSSFSRSKDLERLNLPLLLNSTDSDSEFESAKSEPSDIVDDVFRRDNKLDSDATETVDTLSITETELIEETELITLEIAEEPSQTQGTKETVLDIVTSEVPADKEVSPAPEVDTTLLNTESKIDDNELEGEDDRPQRVRRCSSLKTGKTPPGTPGRKKIVRFADVLGLDLADVKTFMDEIPVIPKSAYDDLTGCDMQNSPPVRAPPRMGSLTLVPLFQVPRDVTDKLNKLNVCLESARVGDGVHINVCGSVRVRNLDFHKTVHIRYSMNRWKTYTDLQATYVPGSCDGFSDRFQFILYAPCISSGQRLEIAVRFQCKGQQLWDNNNGANYCYDCLALGSNANTTTVSSSPLHPVVDWHPSFY